MGLQKLTFSIFLSLIVSNIILGQSHMVVDTLLSPEELIKQVLLKNDNVKVDNIKYRGHPCALGQFQISEERSFCLKKGLSLSTGRVNSNIGPNSSSATSDTLKWSGDKDLEALCKRKTYDAAVLEFDFIPLSNKVSFTYVFASEEYVEYSGSKYNDVFAFFISGPGIKGNKNMAILPRSVKQFVSINSVNQFRNQDYFIDNNCWKLNNRPKDSYEMDMLDKELVQDLEFDGMTIALNAQTNVIPYKKYHFKIAIADVSDMRYNSAVFLKGGSFSVDFDTTATGIFSIVENVDNKKVDFNAIFENKDFDITTAQVAKVETPQEKTIQKVPTEYEEPFCTSKEKEKDINSGSEFISKGVDKLIHKEATPSMFLALPAKFESIQFDHNSDELTDQSKAMLDVLIKMIKVSSPSVIKLSGHTDGKGSSQYNLKLSKHRVSAVAAYLESQGVESTSLLTNYFGEGQPIASNDSKKGRASNRRVEILVEKK